MYIMGSTLHLHTILGKWLRGHTGGFYRTWRLRHLLTGSSPQDAGVSQEVGRAGVDDGPGGAADTPAPALDQVLQVPRPLLHP